LYKPVKKLHDSQVGSIAKHLMISTFTTIPGHDSVLWNTLFNIIKITKVETIGIIISDFPEIIIVKVTLNIK